MVPAAAPAVDTVNVAVLAPGATTTLEGTVAKVELLVSFTFTTPTVGAGVPSVTVPAIVLPPNVEGGFKVTDVTTGGLIVSFPLTDAPFNSAINVTMVVDPTDWVFTAKDADIFPAGIANGFGNWIMPRLVAKLIPKPPVGAGLEIVTVAVVGVNPTTTFGLKVRDTSDGA